MAASLESIGQSQSMIVTTTENISGAFRDRTVSPNTWPMFFVTLCSVAGQMQRPREGSCLED